MACNCSPAWAALTRWFALPTVLLSNLNFNPKPNPKPSPKANPQTSGAADRGSARSAPDPENLDFSLDPQVLNLNPQIPISLLLGLATGSVLVGLQVGQGLLSALVELGELSEEMLRGDRLPILKTQPNLDPSEADSAP